MSGWKRSVEAFWHRTYAGEYLGISILVTVYMLIQLLVEPFHRMFSLDDRSKAFPHALVERVSPFALFLYAGLVPLLFLAMWTLLLTQETHKTHVTILGFVEAVMITLVITDIIKNAAGRGRPDLLARCKPRLGTPANELVTIRVCTETDHHVLHDGWRSFPSGHSSFAFAGLGFAAFFVAGQLHVFRPRADLAHFLVFIVPLVTAALVAMSRLADYRHDVYDVTAGSVLGITVAYVSYRRHYRRLRHSKCDVPYPQRRNMFTEGKSKDEERQQELQEHLDFSSEDSNDDDPCESAPLSRIENRDRSFRRP